jgi:MOSC domain-containing protein YiiM
MAEQVNNLHLSRIELEAGLPHIKQSPQDHGRLEAIAIRPQKNERVTLQQGELSPRLGVHGDNWAQGCWLSLPDGSPDPRVQVSLMNARTIALLAQNPERWAPAGDNLFVDLDLSEANLQPGQRLAIGSVILEITDIAHKGCGKFAERYGAEAARFVNSKAGLALRLRGIYAQIVQAGTVQVGDTIEKLID